MKKYWTYEKCNEDALKYNSRSEWQNNSTSAYNSARKNGWINECCSHMKLLVKPNGYWTKERCLEDALKYKTKTEWFKKSSGSNRASKKHGIFDECTSHMEIIGHKYKRRIYVFLFPKTKKLKKAAYIGLSGRIKKRINTHLHVQGTVYNYIQKNKIKPKFKILTDFLSPEEAQKKEGEWVIKYRNLGYDILNQVKTGNLGGNSIIWTLEKCKEDALKYNSRSEWQKKSGSAYTATGINGWRDKCCGHMKRKKKPNGYWTLEKCKEDALKYLKKSEWMKNSKAIAYGYAYKNRWMDECCAHMIQKKPNGYWTLERCKEDALKYTGRTEWMKNSGSAYTHTSKMGWLDECCKHMLSRKELTTKWTLEKCKEDALKYLKKSEWMKNSKSSYNKSSKEGWLDKCCSHM